MADALRRHISCFTRSPNFFPLTPLSAKRLRFAPPIRLLPISPTASHSAMDCAAIPNPTGPGHLLFAAEGMLESFVESDPWFAGYSAVMVNLSDIAAMGGTPIAITDVLWTPSGEISAEIWAGMRAASLAYGVPIVGGHTTQTTSGKAALAAAVLGHAGERLITSFDANPGEHLVIAIDMNGSYRDGKPFWNASTTTSPPRLRSDLALFPNLAPRRERHRLCANTAIFLKFGRRYTASLHPKAVIPHRTPKFLRNKVGWHSLWSAVKITALTQEVGFSHCAGAAEKFPSSRPFCECESLAQNASLHPKAVILTALQSSYGTRWAGAAFGVR